MCGSAGDIDGRGCSRSENWPVSPLLSGWARSGIVVWIKSCVVCSIVTVGRSISTSISLGMHNWICIIQMITATLYYKYSGTYNFIILNIDP